MVRKPTIYDLGKASKLLSDEEEIQDKILLEWLRYSKDESFYSLVNVERKKVTGILTAVYTVQNDKLICTIGRLHGTKEVKVLLFKKLFKDLTPFTVYIIVEDPKEFEELGFKISNYTMKLERNEE